MEFDQLKNESIDCKYLKMSAGESSMRSKSLSTSESVRKFSDRQNASLSKSTSSAQINLENKDLKCANPSLRKEKHIPANENQQRMNYLIQASRYINSRNDSQNYGNVSTTLGSLSMAIGRKCVIRMLPSLKRSLCKGCGSYLIPSLSAKFRLKNKNQRHMAVTCSKCCTTKQFGTNPDYFLWVEKPEAFSN